jgi:hypothetical protein
MFRHRGAICRESNKKKGTQAQDANLGTVRRGADKSLARPTSPCRRTESWKNAGFRLTLFFGSGPVGLPPVPWTEKTIERAPFFFRRGVHCCRGDLVGRTPF